MNRLWFIAFTLLLIAIPARSADSTAEDREGIRAAVLDYMEGLYSADPSRIERSVHPELNKRGFEPDKSGAYKEYKMTFDELKSLAARWNKNGNRVKADSPREIVILDASDTTAVAKLNAVWGFDLMTLGKYGGKWKIVQILWQTYPKSTP
ncbi:MAG: nuclear transport factor 2 family protein [Bryobacteraceae bacterium]